jgi:homoserine kinase
LGPGFDALALALDVYLDVAAVPRNGARVRLSGSHSEGLPTDDSNLIWQAIQKTWPAAPDFTLEVRNEIPLGRGLGSSGAAAVAGVALANAAGGLGLKPLEILARAVEIEGHPDNVAASTLGGLAIVACGGGGGGGTGGAGGLEAVSMRWPWQVSLVVAIPQCQLATEKARAALPASYSRADTVFNLQRVALLVGAVASGNAPALRAALEDRLHQPYREPLVPGLKEAMNLRVAGLLGVTLSGAGPSLLAFTTDPSPAREALAGIYRSLGVAAEIRHITVAQMGVTCS